MQMLGYSYPAGSLGMWLWQHFEDFGCKVSSLAGKIKLVSSRIQEQAVVNEDVFRSRADARTVIENIWLFCSVFRGCIFQALSIDENLEPKSEAMIWIEDHIFYCASGQARNECQEE